MVMGAHGSRELEQYEELLAHNPDSRAFAQLAEAYRRQGRCADAIAVCDRGLQRYPHDVGARMVLARALVEQGDLARAEAEFRRILDQVPDNTPAYQALGDLLQGQGRAAEALAAYEALLDLTPLHREVRELVETLHASAPPMAAPSAVAAPGVGEPSEAVPEVPLFDLTELATAPPLPLGPARGGLGAEAAGSPPVLASETLADLYAQQGFLDEARAMYQELWRRDPARADLRAKLASLEAPLPAALTEGAAWEPVGASVAAPSSGAAGGDDVVEVLEAWLAAARSLRAERARR